MKENGKIPHKIHYCWFGGNPLPKSAVKCIESWKKYFPEYEIIEWNENNYNVNKIPYIQQAYKAKKYAFVSDYARFDILYNEGGIYFDTDVEVIRSFEDILAKGAFMGCEIDGDCLDSNSQSKILIHAGIGLGAAPKLEVYREILMYYNNQSFIMTDGSRTPLRFLPVFFRLPARSKRLPAPSVRRRRPPASFPVRSAAGTGATRAAGA